MPVACGDDEDIPRGELSGDDHEAAEAEEKFDALCPTMRSGLAIRGGIGGVLREHVGVESCGAPDNLVGVCCCGRFSGRADVIAADRSCAVGLEVFTGSFECCPGICIDESKMLLLLYMPSVQNVYVHGALSALCWCM